MYIMPSSQERALRSKIARLPLKFREHINEMLLDGAEGKDVLEWLNVQHDIPHNFNHQNLSAWRKTGYEIWLQGRKEVDTVRSLADMSYSLAEAGGADISTGAAAILGGKILESLIDVRKFDLEDEEGRHRFFDCVNAVTRLQASSSQDRRARVAESQLKQREQQLAQREREINLNEDKFKMMVSEKIMEAAKSPEVQAILGDNSLNRSQQLKAIEILMFGDQVPVFPS